MMGAMICQKCRFEFPYDTDMSQFFQHVKCCKSQKSEKKIQSEMQYEKVPLDNTNTKFKWERCICKDVPPKILKKSEVMVKKMSFQEKQYWFRNQIEKNRVNWVYGADFMILERDNILMSSLVQVKKVNMHKEVKIEFKGDKVNDAGGLLREWIHLVIKQIFNLLQGPGLFSIANTDDVMYKLKWDCELDSQFSTQLLRLLGVIIGKCLFERIPLNCYLDRTILRQLCEQSVKMEDIYGYDKDLYKQWNNLLNTQQIEELETYFVVHKQIDHQIREIQLMQDGKSILVDDENKMLFVDMCSQMITTEQVQRSINAIRSGISVVFQNKFLSIFEPFELEMLLYGVPFIDIDDWEQNTEYKSPYSANHKIIKWFWQVMKQFDQEQLANILHFCTGSSRTPIHGFKKLETNRGNCSRFLIQSSKFNKSNPYPKGHTCFNRLELPMYSKFEEIQMYLKAISNNNLDGVFGLD